MDGLHLKVSLFQQGTDSSSWNHTWVVAVPVAVPDDMQESRNNRTLVDFCNPDKLQAVPRVEQNATAPGIVPVQDSSSRAEKVRRVLGTRSFRAVLSVACPLLKQVRQLVDDWPVSLQLARLPWLQPGCDLRRMVL